MSQIRFDIPTVDAGTRPFWDAIAEGRLLIKRCRDCSRPHFYPRGFCPHCWSEAVEWEQASGRATLYTWSVIYVNDLPPFDRRVPYIAAVAELAEGPRVMTTARLPICEPEWNSSWHAGQLATRRPFRSSDPARPGPAEPTRITKPHREWSCWPS